MNDQHALEKLHDALLELYPPGPKRMQWLAWLMEVASMSDCPSWSPRGTADIKKGRRRIPPAL
jgi:hypothetical protein